MSALDGSLLWRQIEYGTLFIDIILQKLYKGNRASMILIGHSMGGVVALGCIAHEQYVKGSVSMILTLNTPHLRLPIMIDPSLVSFYHHVNSFWFNAHYQMSKAPNSSYDLVKEITVLSIAGGFKDKLVHATLSNIQDVIIPSSHCISVVTTSIPFVRLHADHQVPHLSSQKVFKLTYTRTLFGATNWSELLYKV